MDVSTEFPGPTPQLVVDDAERAIGFYRTAFGADELVRNNAPDGRVMHCELLLLTGDEPSGPAVPGLRSSAGSEGRVTEQRTREGAAPRPAHASGASNSTLSEGRK